MAKIENLNHMIKNNIKFVFFRKFVTVFVQKRKKNVNTLGCSHYQCQYLDLNPTCVNGHFPSRLPHDMCQFCLL